jgi:2-polyprenyl-3-methyl-5-hydroxy-6-metoxy-1,4-benzoquinol methylase
MSKFSHRSDTKELLDADDIPFEDIKLNMQELNTINGLLGGHAISIKGLKKLLLPGDHSLSICEIGCGGGDNLKVIHDYCSRQAINATLTGIDIKENCISFAAQNSSLPANWICSDYKKVSFGNNKPDIIFASLFCHHFNKKELVSMMHWMNQNSRRGFFINDLHRHPLAYYSIKAMTGIFSRSYLVKNDAPVSVTRGFIKQEWEDIFEEAAISPVDISWQWAFRHLIVYKK